MKGTTMSRAVLRIGVLGIACAIALASATSSSAAVKRSATTATINSVEVTGDAGGRWLIAGKLKSRSAKCQANRKLKLIKVGAGAQGSGKTGSGATFVLDMDYFANVAAADYEVRVAKKVVGKGKRRQICKGDVAVATFKQSPSEVQVSVAYGPANTFTGQVTSVDVKCVQGAFVLRWSDLGPQIIGAAPTDAAGSWIYEHPAAVDAGTYSAAATGLYHGIRRSGGDYEHVLCQDGYSPQIVVG